MLRNSSDLDSPAGPAPPPCSKNVQSLGVTLFGSLDRRKDHVLVGFSGRNVNFELAYSAESDTFSRLTEICRSQVKALQNQRPRSTP